ncbi:50S ribosomal protein L25 [Caloramator proteoclasticus]|uniref:Large ribosomal subunit protein bL25 n=1 Tax=Caloramator proteoclasticus DSM 10124 TaxID=1121262 RepID=A0A1M4WMA1_9CLOT|nr:50S ribosomal protein L25 [Caloramator proteoclasticus]SHE82366.1 large subunit ribosomal protein L25 [Caloramator proteoclasticus DSM 10124]
MQIQAKVRQRVSKSENHRLRKSGKLPAVIYGLNRENFNIEIAMEDVFEVLKKDGPHAIVDINVDGKHENAMIKDIQRDPIDGKVLHVDFERVEGNKKVHTKVPINYTGEDYLKSRGLLIQKEISYVEVDAPADRIPKNITIDLSSITGNYKVTLKDVEIAEEIAIDLSENATIAQVYYLKEEKNQDTKEVQSL